MLGRRILELVFDEFVLAVELPSSPLPYRCDNRCDVAVEELVYEGATEDYERVKRPFFSGDGAHVADTDVRERVKDESEEVSVN